MSESVDKNSAFIKIRMDLVVVCCTDPNTHSEVEIVVLTYYSRYKVGRKQGAFD